MQITHESPEENLTGYLRSIFYNLAYAVGHRDADVD